MGRGGDLVSPDFGKKFVAENFFRIYNKVKERRVDKGKSFSAK